MTMTITMTAMPEPFYSFTPVFDHIVQEHGNKAARVYGVIWRRCRESGGFCSLTVREYRERSGVTCMDILRILPELVQAGYIVDLTPDEGRRTHVYRLGRPLAPLSEEAI